ASGLQKGDLIIGINNMPIGSLGDLRKTIDAKPPVLALNIKRGNEEIYLLLRNSSR
ncbi:PDZ domain-containing protein, partial [Klebsiella aerogenes]|nr:PDZ domain-containing protein [Klebsiella aerogenes]